MTIRTDYSPGVCNIGSAEIRRRRFLGAACLGAAILLGVALVLADAAPGWFLVLVVPAFGSALGFVQAAFGFCIYFGLSARFNLGGAGAMARIANPASRRTDRAASLRLLALSALIATVVALGAYAAALAR